MVPKIIQQMTEDVSFYSKIKQQKQREAKNGQLKNKHLFYESSTESSSDDNNSDDFIQGDNIAL